MDEIARPDEPSAIHAAPEPSRLKRVRNALLARDWLGIGIELAVVTIGILLAFQIEQWGEARQRAKEERQFLERMWQETANAIEETEWAMTMHGRFRREFIQGFNALNDPAALARLKATPNIGCRAAVMPALGFNDTTFQELSASGRLNMLNDPQLRSDLRDVVAAQADAEGNRQNNYGLAIENQRALNPYYLLGLDRNDNRTCRMDWPRLARDPVTRTALVRSVRLHTLLWNKRAYARDKLAIVHNRIACTLAKSDCRDAVPQIFRVRPRYDVVPPEARDDVQRSAEMYKGS
jgi:hypothetical protein